MNWRYPGGKTADNEQNIAVSTALSLINVLGKLSNVRLGCLGMMVTFLGVVNVIAIFAP